MSGAGDDAERSDAEERRKIPAGDDAVGAPPAAQRRGGPSDEEERRKIPAGDDAVGHPQPRSGEGDIAMRRSGANEH